MKTIEEKDIYKVRTHYLVKYLALGGEIIIDDQDKEEVYAMIHCCLLNPDCEIYVCFNDGSMRKLDLSKEIR